MNRNDCLSLALHTRVAEKLRAQPALWAVVQRNISTMLASPASSPQQAWGLRWQPLLADPRQALALLVEDSDHAQQYRSSSPFSGVLSQQERSLILAEVNRETQPA